MKRVSAGVVMLGLLVFSPNPADASKGSSGLLAPKGLRPCDADDPAAVAEARVATKLGGEFLGCFRSERTVKVPSSANSFQVPTENAFALALPGQNYTPKDLDNLLSKVEDQWKNFAPLSKEFTGTYLARLNDLIKGINLTPPPTVASVKPILVSIERIDKNYYVVTSIRAYSFELSGENIITTKINSDAVVLRSSQLIRLTIQRTLRDPADVARVQGEVADWARSIVQS